MSNSRDRQILNSIVTPLLPIGEGVYDEQEEEEENDEDVELLMTPEIQISMQHEKEGIEEAEKGNFEEAIAKFGYGM